MLTLNKSWHFQFMEIGTHNSMSYLEPKRWYMYPFRFIAKCQSMPINEQYKKGIRLFDIRISYNKNNYPEFRHGSMAFKGDVFEILTWLNNQGDPIKIRLILEEKNESKLRESLFIGDVSKFKVLFPNLTFYEGRRKFDWKQIADLPTLDITQLVGSMSGKLIYKIYPKLYAKKYNDKNINTYLDIKPLLIDFFNG